MNSIQGRVVGRRSGSGVPDLVVVAYDVVGAGRDDCHDDGGPGLGQRLGSTLTDHHGAFTITYADDEFASAARRRPDLQVAVFAGNSESAAKPLATGGAVRRCAGRKESWLIRLPEAPSAAANATPSAAHLRALAERYTSASERPRPGDDDHGSTRVAFSRRYRDARARQAAATQALAPAGRAPGTFVATHAVIIDQGRGGGEVAFDPQANRLSFRPAAGGAAVALRFVGVRYRRAGEAPAVLGTALIIDSARAEAHLSIPWSASLIATVEATPGALYADHAGRRRRAAAAARQAANDDRAPPERPA